MSETKTYVFPESNSGGNSGMWGLLSSLAANKGIDPNLLLTMRGNNGFGGEGGWFIWVIFLFFLMGWGRGGWGGCGNGSGGGGGLANEINNDYGRGLLLQAINGNGQAIGQLASTLNCDVNAIQQSINQLMSAVQGIGNQVGMSGQQIINAIQAGNCQLAGQLSQCCCDLQTAITRQGYDNQLATLNQTNTLASKIEAQTAFLSDKFCQLEKRDMQQQISALQEQKSTLQGIIDNANQTININNATAQAIAPVAGALNALQAEVAGIKCRLPDSVNVPYSPVTAVPNCVAYGLGLGYGYGPYPYGYNGGLWG